MRTPYRDLASPEIWERSIERSRRRRATAQRDRRRDARRKQASAAATVAMVAAPATPLAAAQSSGAEDGRTSADSPAKPATAGQGQLLFRLGSAGPAVVEIQRALSIDRDGIFGNQTDAAVRNFQARSGLLVDGIVGPRTWTALFGLGTAAGAASSDAKAANVATGESAQAPAAPASASASAPAASGGGADLVFALDAGQAPGGSGSDGVGSVQRFAIGAPRGSAEVCGSSRISGPVRGGIVTSHFGPRGGRNHDGIDIAAPHGTRVRAAACGIVSQLGYMGGYGNMVCVKHTSRFTTCYAHLSRFDSRRGEQVRKGEVIGYVGCTGSCTGPHVHFETRVDGTARNPSPYLRGRGIPGRPSSQPRTRAASSSSGSPTMTLSVSRQAPSTPQQADVRASQAQPGEVQSRETVTTQSAQPARPTQPVQPNGTTQSVQTETTQSAQTETTQSAQSGTTQSAQSTLATTAPTQPAATQSSGPTAASGQQAGSTAQGQPTPGQSGATQQSSGAAPAPVAQVGPTGVQVAGAQPATPPPAEPEASAAGGAVAPTDG